MAIYRIGKTYHNQSIENSPNDIIILKDNTNIVIKKEGTLEIHSLPATLSERLTLLKELIALYGEYPLIYTVNEGNTYHILLERCKQFDALCEYRDKLDCIQMMNNSNMDDTPINLEKLTIEEFEQLLAKAKLSEYARLEEENIILNKISKTGFID